MLNTTIGEGIGPRVCFSLSKKAAYATINETIYPLGYCKNYPNRPTIRRRPRDWGGFDVSS